MPTDSDRKKIKDQQKGVFLTAAAISSPNTEVEKLHEEVFVFDLDADASQAERGVPCLKAFKVKSVVVLPSTDLAAHATAYVTYTTQKRPSAALGTPVSVAAFDTATGGSNVSLTAWTAYSVTLTTTLANRKFAVGDVLTFKSAETSTPTSPLGRVAITVEYI